MTKLQNKLRRMRLFELMRQRGMGSNAGCKLRVSRLTDEEGEEAILLRTLAARSLTTPHNRRV
ncbi:MULTISPECIES: hypothetical protein [unclassified Leisingera]|uniref:hypothetical protein n=1 Tax=unclassified Leisingera TaxID=2614906 RepID=UPI00057F5073|nr:MULTISPECIES: hypothetical protein [unclassified Leisingera]KIC19457.1 hypothetical protein RA21_02840 [Leisingera sp. ANG-DT]KIC27459.1 hypothetical protein RA24_16580 [Leisingera sp. ANG-M6]KIC33845.1 hypothetical protein RA25_07755 [Leisingera sp. ANG-S5]